MKLLVSAVLLLAATALAVRAEPLDARKRAAMGHDDDDDDDDDDTFMVETGALKIVAGLETNALQALSAMQGGVCGYDSQAFAAGTDEGDVLPQGIVQSIDFNGEVDDTPGNALELGGTTALCPSADNELAIVAGDLTPNNVGGTGQTSPNSNTGGPFPPFVDGNAAFYTIRLKCPVTNVVIRLAGPSPANGGVLGTGMTEQAVFVDASRGDGPVTQVVVLNQFASVGVLYLSVSALDSTFDNIAVRIPTSNGFCISQIDVGCDEFNSCFCKVGGDDDDDDDSDDDDDDNLKHLADDDDDDDDDGDDDDDDDSTVTTTTTATTTTTTAATTTLADNDDDGDDDDDDDDGDDDDDDGDDDDDDDDGDDDDDDDDSRK